MRDAFADRFSTGLLQQQRWEGTPARILGTTPRNQGTTGLSSPRPTTAGGATVAMAGPAKPSGQQGFARPKSRPTAEPSHEDFPSVMRPHL